MKQATKENREHLQEVEDEIDYLELKTRLLWPILSLIIPVSFYITAILLIVSALGKGREAAPRAAFGIAAAMIGFIAMVISIVKIVSVIINRKKYKVLVQEKEQLLSTYDFEEQQEEKEQPITNKKTKSNNSDLDKERELLLLKLYSEGKISKDEFDEYFRKDIKEVKK